MAFRMLHQVLFFFLGHLVPVSMAQGESKFAHLEWLIARTANSLAAEEIQSI